MKEDLRKVNTLSIHTNKHLQVGKRHLSSGTSGWSPEAKAHTNGLGFSSELFLTTCMVCNCAWEGVCLPPLLEPASTLEFKAKQPGREVYS